MRKLFLLLPVVAVMVALVATVASAAIVGSRYQAENMTTLPANTNIQDEATDDGTHVRFSANATAADLAKQTINTLDPVDEIRLTTRESGGGLGDDKLAVYVDGTAAGNKVGTVQPPAGSTWATQTITLATPISAGAHTIWIGPNQTNDAFVALDYFELHNTGTVGGDAEAPNAQITSAPQGTTTDTTPTFTFSATDNVGIDHYGCRTFLVGTSGGSFANCTSPHTTSTLANGEYKFQVRAYDAAGNYDQAGETFTVSSSGGTPTGVVLAGAGDIGDCSTDDDRLTGDLVEAILANTTNAHAFSAGDIAYEVADTATIRACYDEGEGSPNESWGDFISNTYFTVGNHEYKASSTATDFFNFFDGGVSLAPTNYSNTNSYYTVNLSSQWVGIFYNSNKGNGTSQAPSCDVGSAQYNFVENALQDAKANGKSVVGFSHHPRFSQHSSRGDDNTACAKNFFDVFAANDGDVIVNGHNHFYERYSKRTATGANATGDNGVTQYIVGTGGRENDAFGSGGTTHDFGRVDHGILRLKLNSDGTYNSEFRSVNGNTYDVRTENSNP